MMDHDSRHRRDTYLSLEVVVRQVNREQGPDQSISRDVATKVVVRDSKLLQTGNTS